MNVFDIIIAVLLLYGFARGFFKGFFVEIASLFALLGGVYGAMHFSHYVGQVLKEKLDWAENYISLSAFAITFLIIVLLVSLAGKILTKVASFAALGIVNKILGGFFGLLKFALIISVVLGFFLKINNNIPFMSKDQVNTSLLAGPIKELAPSLFPQFLETKKSIVNIISDYNKP